VAAEVEDRLRLKEVLPHEAVILVRTGEQTRVFEQELRRRNIPYELVGSRSFFDRREVKDVMSFLRFLIEPDDDMALLRIANVPPRGLSAQTIAAARTAATITGHSLWSELLACRQEGKLSPHARAGIDSLERLVSIRATASHKPAAETLGSLLEAVGYRQFLTKEYADPAEQDARWGSVEELVNALAAHDCAHRGRREFAQVIRDFLDALVLDVTETERFRDDKPKGNVLRLMTLHAAKGLEFDCVWMVGMEEGLLPHHRSLNDGLQAIDEERRLCYVGVTRAKKRLTLSLCLTRMKWGKSRPSRPSRFLYELTGQADKFSDEAPQREKPVPAHPRGRKKAVRKTR
jgi:DNA helicase-2/ATP-dependent DNA helicase PcrA